MLESSELVEMLGSTNDWYVRKARRLLADRRDPQAVKPLAALVTGSKNDHLALEALWALYVSGGLDNELAEKLLGHRNADVRWWTVRLLGDEEKVAPPIARRLAEMGRRDDSIAVRSQLACTARRLPSPQALPIVKELVAREDAVDPYLPLLLWWAVESHADDAQVELLAMFADEATRKLPLVHDTILPRLMRRSAAEATQVGYLACAKLLETSSAADRGMMLIALDQGLKDRTASRGGSAGTLFANLAENSAVAVKRDDSAGRVPAQLVKQIESAWRDDTDDVVLIRLLARLGNQKAQARAVELTQDDRLPVPKRVEAVQLLAEVGRPSCVAALLELLTSDKPLALQVAVLEALPAFDDDGIAQVLVDAYPKLPAKLQAKVCDVLLSRKAWAARLLELVDAEKFPAKDIAVDQLRVVALHHDERLDALVKKHWGSIQGGTPEERLAEMRRINNDLRAAPGDAAAGKELFTKHCGTCHKLFGEGNQIGPELTHANRKNTDELLATIVSPSATIRKEFMSYVVQTTDGRVVTGVIAAQSPSSITLLGAKNERSEIERDKIESLVESPVSLMPENLLGPLRPQELRDLFSYLQSEEQVAGAK